MHTKDSVAVANKDNESIRIDSRDLFNESSELIILHNDEEYHLRITRNEKLILTK